MKVLIVGLGSIANKHISVLREINPEIEIYALRSSHKSKKYKKRVARQDCSSKAKGSVEKRVT